MSVYLSLIVVTTVCLAKPMYIIKHASLSPRPSPVCTCIYLADCNGISYIYYIHSCWLIRFAMPKLYSEYTKQLVEYYHQHGFKSGNISRVLQEGTIASRRGIAKFLAKLIECKSVVRKLGSGEP